MSKQPKQIAAPPMALDLEAAVLGAMLLERDAYIRLEPPMKTEMFYDQRNQAIYTAVQALVARGEQPDILTATAELRKLGKLEQAGGALYVTELTSSVASSANIEVHAAIVRKAWIARELMRLAGEAYTSAADPTKDVLEVFDAHQHQLDALTQSTLISKPETFQQLVKQVVDQMGAAAKADEGITGIRTGLDNIDRLTSGLHDGELTIIGGRPAMGKTEVGIHIARTAAEHGVHVYFFSLEMQAQQIAARCLSQFGRINKNAIRTGRDKYGNPVSIAETVEAASRLTAAISERLTVEQASGLHVLELGRKVKVWLRKLPQTAKKLVVVDYLQLLHSSSRDRYAAITEISITLKQIALKNNLPLIALAQLSRSVEQRGGDKRPQLADLRDSGSIEQDADNVCFLYRPEYYGMETDSDGNSTKHKLEYIIAKQRNGAVDTAHLYVNMATGYLADWGRQDDADAHQHQPGFSQEPPPPQLQPDWNEPTPF